MSASKLSQLALRISENTNKVDEYLRSKGLPQPSFDVDGPVKLGIESVEIEAAKKCRD